VVRVKGGGHSVILPARDGGTRTKPEPFLSPPF
jgi:hypothetical protein